MKPDRFAMPEERSRKAHLVDPADASHSLARYPAPGDLVDLLQWWWVPVWSVPAGQRSEQRVLQYPCALIVITQEYARFYGVDTGLSSTELEGDGWAVGVLLQPAAGSLVSGRPMSELTDTHVELEVLLGDRGATLADDVRRTMAAVGRDRWADPRVHARAIAPVADRLRSFLPVDEEGCLVNELVARVESDPEILRVEQLVRIAAMSERSLQRLLRRRLGLTPKWLIQRRRLQDLSLRLRERGDGEHLAGLAAELGYADEAHMIRDFRTVTGWTPAAFAERFGT